MSANKRKFHALLSSLGNTSTTSLTSQASHASSTDRPVDDTTSAWSSSLSKKRRVSGILGGSTSRLRGRPASLTDATAARTNSMSAAAASPAPSEPPKYAPWDRTAFLRRLKSFANLTDWAPKPAPVNEVEWAKRGWMCQGPERVRCAFCSVEMVVMLNKKERDGAVTKVYMADEIEQALIEKYAELIVSSHRDDCPWKSRGCDDTIFKLPLNHPATTYQGIRERYDELVAMTDHLPYLHNLSLPTGFDLDETLKHLPSDLFPPAGDSTVSTTDINKVALAMALCGWQSKSGRPVAAGAAGCAVCFRTLGLWMFRSKEVDASTGHELQPATIDRLDPVEEHREYCPWRSAAAQSGAHATEPVAAWQVVQRVIRNDWTLRGAHATTTAGASSGKGGGDPSRREHDKHRSFPSLPNLMHRRNKSVASTADSAVAGDEAPSGRAAAADGLDPDGDEDAQTPQQREQKDTERWARLRRVKSLFDAKGSKKRHRKMAASTSASASASAAPVG